MGDAKIAVIVATKNRRDDLSRLLESLMRQSRKPDQIIIVDGGDEKIDDLWRDKTSIRIDYIKVAPPSLPAQRNAGINAMDKGINIAAFLDDDITLEEDSLKNIMLFWAEAPEDAAGAAFNNIEENIKRAGMLEKLFYVNNNTAGEVLRSGFQTRPFPLKGDTEVQWLIGCAMTYRTSVFKERMFDENYKGYAPCEDVDFSYGLSMKYKLFVVENAKVRHHFKHKKTDFSFAYGKAQVVNRMYFVKKYPALSPALCMWACFGLFLNNTLKGIVHFDKYHLLRAMGNATGFIKVLFRKKIKPGQS